MASPEHRTKPRQEATTIALNCDRKAQHTRERLSRQRRRAKLEEMRRMVDKLEQLMVIVRTVDDNDAVWDDFLDEKTRRNRRTFVQILRLSKETQTLKFQRIQLQQLLTEHRLSTNIIVDLLNERFKDNWEAKVEYYRQLTQQHFQPWTIEACREEMDAALKEFNAFQWSMEKQTTNLRLFGWRENQRFDSIRGTFQFEFYKDFHGFDIMDGVNATWDMFTDRETYVDIVMSPFQHRFFEVLQQIGPNNVITRGHHRYPGVIGDVHFVYLVSRARTSSGYVQCVRSVHCPELVRVFSSPSDLWVTDRMWSQLDRLDGNTPGYTFRVGGTLRAPDVNYGQNWMMKVFGALLRLECLATGTQLITSE